MRNYCRLMLGRKSIHAEDCLAGSFVGIDFEMPDFTGKLPDRLREFNKTFIPVYLKTRPDKSKISDGLACGAIWTVSKRRRQHLLKA